ncbi:MAG: hypothetical protein RI955_1250, partial [Bacteroidota bacterium]
MKSNFEVLKNIFMQKRFLPLMAMLLFVKLSTAQVTPEISSWMLNTTGATGYSNITSNCQQVQYSTNYVYVSCSCIPGYSIGPWMGNPNIPSNQNFVYKIPRNPIAITGTPTNVGMGHIGVWKNGVSIFNVYDGYWWNTSTNAWSSTPGPGTHAWNRNAYIFEAVSFDNCLGHPQQQGEYHHHVSPNCLYNQADSTHHSPIIGYAFDGFPVYGAYAYTNTNGTGAIKRMKSSYVLTTATTRTNGPAISTANPLGAACEDYIYTQGAGDLDAHNGRFCVTPDYPNGIYAYFVTIDATLKPTFPYTFYGTYYGVVETTNTGMNSGHATITETVTTYIPDSTSAGLTDADLKLDFMIMPNPASTILHIFIQPIYANDFTIDVYDLQGRKMISKNNVHPTIIESLDVSQLVAGEYIVKVYNNRIKNEQK